MTNQNTGMNFNAPFIVDDNTIENESSKTTKPICGKKKNFSEPKEHCETDFVTFSCKECSHDYCSDCFNRDHKSKLRKSHQKIPFTNKNTILKCQKHSKISDVFCLDDEQIVCYDCILKEHKSHNIVKMEEAIEFYQRNLKKKKKEIEKSLFKVKKEQTKVDEEFKKLKKEYEIKSIEFEQKKEKFEFELKKIIELELNQNLKELIEFKDKIGAGGDGDWKLNVSEKKLFDKIYAFGDNTCGQLGIEKGDEIKTPTMISFFKDTKIQTLSSGRYHTIVLTGNQDSLLIYNLKTRK